jgi:methylenetetrahydrofolate--tRNA-(uracil-5-)-methyltransferase
MKPVGLTDPRTGQQPYAVVQLRREDREGTLFNLVGFQTKLTWPAQQQVFRMIPGLEEAEFVRFGSVHRNTFLNAPALLDETLQLRTRPGLFLPADHRVEGYMESAAMGPWPVSRPAVSPWAGPRSRRRPRKPPWGPWWAISNGRTRRPSSP